MRDDPIVNEIRKIRKTHTDKFDGDLHAICEDLRRQELQSEREFVSLPPRRIPEATLTDASCKNGGTSIR